MNYSFFKTINIVEKRKETLNAPQKLLCHESSVANCLAKDNEQSQRQVLRAICGNVYTANLFFNEAVEIASRLEKKDPLITSNTVNILPMMIKNENLKKFTTQVESSSLSGKTKALINERVDMVKLADRIITNENSIKLRYDINGIVSKSGISESAVKSCVEELCELIDTYSIPVDHKLNIALENINYAMARGGKNTNGEVSNYIIDEFLSINPVITDKDMKNIKHVIESNLLLTDDIRKDYMGILEASGKYYEDKIDHIAEMCDDPENAEFIRNVKKIKNEKQASNYINVALNRINTLDLTVNDNQMIMYSISVIPLMGYISKSFVQYELSMQKKFIKARKKLGADLSEDFMNALDIAEMADDDEIDEMLEENTDLTKLAEYVEKAIPTVDIFSESYVEPITALLETEQMSDADMIKDVLKKFKADQNKSVGRFKSIILSIYKKSPRAIIESLPNVFSVVRVVFILGTATVPVVGPILAILLAFIDHLISMDINRRQTEAIIRALDEERDLVKRKIDKGGETEDLKKYLECIERCTKKVEAYRDTITDDSIEGREDDDDPFGDDFDFELEDCKDFYMYTDSITKILEAKNNKDIMNILSNTDLLMEAGIDTSLEVLKRCPNLVDFSTIQEAFQAKLTDYSMVAEANKFYDSIYNTPVYEDTNVLDDLLFERCVVEELEQVVEEGVNLSTLKLAMQNVKKKFRDLSTKEKEVCQTVDVNMSQFMKSVEKSMTSNRREALIRGSMIPSFSKCLKSAMVVGGAAVVNPVLGMITAMGMIGVSKKLNHRERQLIYDEIETELKVVDKQINIAENDGDMNQYRFLLQYQKKLERERQRIKYGLKVQGRDIPTSSAGRRSDY